MIDQSYQTIPDYTMDALKRYIEQRLQPGGFLTAVLSNDLREAVARADDNNMEALPTIVAWLYNEAASNCWGSPAKVAEWLARR